MLFPFCFPLIGLAFALAHCASVPQSSRSALVHASDTLVFERELGSGVFGTVYQAALSGRSVAVKVIQKTQNYLKDLDTGPWRIVREIVAMERTMNCQYVVGLHGVLDDICNVYIVMDYERVGSAKDVLQRLQDAIHPQLVKRFMVDILQAVKFIHSKDIIHMDISLANLLVSAKGHLRLCDFGSAEVVRGEVVFTSLPSNFPPELFQGEEFTEAGDVWLIGAAVHHLITGIQFSTCQIQCSMHTLDVFYHHYSDIMAVLRHILLDDPRATIHQLLNDKRVVQWQADESLESDAQEQLARILELPEKPLTRPQVTFDQKFCVSDFDNRLRQELKTYNSNLRIYTLFS